MVATPKKIVPKHVELRDKLRSRFQRMAPNSLIPSARELAKTYKVSAMTVRQALVALQQEGMIHSVPGLGTFVSDHKMSKKLTFVSFSQEISERGMKPSSKIVTAIKTTVKSQDVADSLNIKVGDPVYKIERVRFADKIPMALEESFVSAELIPGLLLERCSSIKRGDRFDFKYSIQADS